MSKFSLLFIFVLVLQFNVGAEDAATGGDGIGIKFYDKLLQSYAPVDNKSAEHSKLGKISQLENFTKNKSLLEQRIRPNSPWREKLKYEEDKIKVDKGEGYLPPPVRSNAIYFPGPTKAFTGAAHSPISAKIASEVLKGPMALYFIAMQQTDPAIGSGLDMAEQYSQNMIDRAVSLEASFIKSLDNRPDGQRIKDAYYGCITRHMNGDEYPEVVAANAATPHKDPNKTWLQAIHFCLNDSLYHQGANFDSLTVSAAEGQETFLNGLDSTYITELSKNKNGDAWKYCGDPLSADNPASKYTPSYINTQTVSPATLSAVGEPQKFKADNESIHRTVISIANLIFCPQIMSSVQSNFVGPLLPGTARVEDIVALRTSWLELFGDYLIAFEQGREIKLAVDPTYGTAKDVKIPDFSVAKTYVQRIPATRANRGGASAAGGGAAADTASYPVELYYDIKAARFRDLAWLLTNQCMTNETPAFRNPSKTNENTFWAQLVSGKFPEDALRVSRLSLNSHPFNVNAADMLLELLFVRTSTKTEACEIVNLLGTENGYKDINEKDPFLDIYSIYWNYVEFVAFEQLMNTYLLAKLYVNAYLSTVSMDEPVLAYAHKMIDDAAGTNDIEGAIYENAQLFEIFYLQASAYKEKYKGSQSSSDDTKGKDPK